MSLQDLPFAIDRSFPVADRADYALLLGHVFTGHFGYRYMVVKAGAAIGSAASTDLYAAGKCLKWTDRTLHTVEGGVANTDLVCGALSYGTTTAGTATGVAPATILGAIASGDIFLMQVSGRYSGRVGVTGGDQVDEGEYVFASTDADTGKLDDGGTTFSRATFGIAAETSATADALVAIDLICGASAGV